MVEPSESGNASHTLSKLEAKLQDFSFALSDASTEANQDATAGFGEGEEGEDAAVDETNRGMQLQLRCQAMREYNADQRTQWRWQLYVDLNKVPFIAAFQLLGRALYESRRSLVRPGKE